MARKRFFISYYYIKNIIAMLIFHRFLKFLYAAPTTITFFKVCLLGNIVFPPPADSNIQTLTTLNGSNGFFCRSCGRERPPASAMQSSGLFQGHQLCMCVSPRPFYSMVQWLATQTVEKLSPWKFPGIFFLLRNLKRRGNFF